MLQEKVGAKKLEKRTSNSAFSKDFTRDIECANQGIKHNFKICK